MLTGSSDGGPARQEGVRGQRGEGVRGQRQGGPTTTEGSRDAQTGRVLLHEAPPARLQAAAH